MNTPIDEQNREEILEQLDKLTDEMGDRIQTCEYQTAFDLNGERRRIAKAAGIAEHYLLGTFFQMVQAAYLLDYATSRERAVEMIALLGDIDQLLKIEPDLSPDAFEFYVYELRPCAFEVMADSSAEMEGFNSDGLHECIAGGLQVCRDVGKTGCVNCFREYAGDVYVAADDFELAEHQCRLVVAHEGEWQARGNRHWVAQSKLGWIEALRGNLHEARSLLETAMEMTKEEGVSLGLESRLRVLFKLDSVRILLGEEQLIPNDEVSRKLPATGECGLFDLEFAHLDALEKAVAGDFDGAEQILLAWDQKLLDRDSLNHWFENRLRRIAARKLAGDDKGAEVLAENVEDRAKQANDWLTIRRLNETLEGKNISPLGVAIRDEPVSTSVTPDEQAEPAGDSRVPKMSEECEQHLDQLSDRLRETMQQEDPGLRQTGIASLRNELMQVTSERSRVWTDVAGYLSLANVVIQFDSEIDLLAIWKWANRLVFPFRNNGSVLSILGATGHQIGLASEDPDNPVVTIDRVTQLFKRALELVTDGPGTYARAGRFYADINDVGEAERCFARSFKLNRTDGDVALSLADVYHNTDRPRDALHVLDLCLREGTDDPRVAYRAGLLAFELRQFEVMATYFDRCTELTGAEEASPLHYYRSIGHLRAERAKEALECIQKEVAEAEDDDALIHCVCVEACVQCDLGNEQEARRLFGLAVRMKPKDHGYVPPADLQYVLQLLYEYIPRINPVATDIEQLEDRLLSLNMMPESFYDDLRAKRNVEDELTLFIVALSQPLGDDWADHDNCLPAWQEWDHYIASWGVLAEEPEEAIEQALEMQRRICSIEPAVLSADPDSGPFQDSPGVAFQGQWTPIPLEYMSDDEAEE